MYSLEYGTLFRSLVRNVTFAALAKSQMNNISQGIEKVTPWVIDSLSHDGNEPQENRHFLIEQFELFKEAASAKTVEFMIFEFLVCRNAEAFDYYLTQILKQIFLTRPEILTSSEKPLTVEELLSCSTKDEIVSRIVERKVSGLAYKGLQDQIEYLNRTIKLGFPEDTQAFYDTCELFQVRNLIVHNATIINEIYLERTKNLQHSGPKNLTTGDVYPLTEEYVFNGTGNLINVAVQLDMLLMSKFSLTK